MKKLIAILSLLLIASFSYGQEFTLSGIVEVKSSAEPIAFANVYISELERGAQTDLNGKFSIKLPAGEYTLKITAVGYQDFTESIKINSDKKITFKVKA